MLHGRCDHDCKIICGQIEREAKISRPRTHCSPLGKFLIPPTSAHDWRHAETVRTVLTKILGTTGAEAVSFYDDVPDLRTFESKLKAILGQCADVILQEVRMSLDVN